MDLMSRSVEAFNMVGLRYLVASLFGGGAGSTSGTLILDKESTKVELRGIGGSMTM